VGPPTTALLAAVVTSGLYRGGMDFMVYTGARYVVKEAKMWREV